MKKIKQILYSAVLLFCSIGFSSFAEEVDAKLKDAQFVIEKDISITLSEEQQIFANTELSESLVTKPPTLEYDLNKLKVDLGLLSHNAKMLIDKQELQEKLYHCYVKAGHGTAMNPIFELAYGNTYNSSWNYGAFLKHYSEASRYGGYFEDVINSANIYISKLIGSILIGANIDYGYDKYVFTNGGRDSILEYPSQIRSDSRYISHLDLVTHLRNYEDSKLRYCASLGYYGTSIENNLNEHQISSYSKITYDLSETRKIINKNSIFLSKYTSSENTIGRYFFENRVIDKFVRGNFNLHYGLFLNLDNDSFGKEVFLGTICPILGIEYNFRSWMIPYYTFLDGYSKTHSLRSVIGENPYIKNSFQLHNEHGAKIGDLGIKGKMSQQFSYKTGIKIIMIDKTLSYNNSGDTENEFVPIYSETSQFISHAEIKYSSTDESLKSIFNISHINYFKSFNLNPTFIVDWLSTYKFLEKWMLKGNLSVIAGHTYLEKSNSKLQKVNITTGEGTIKSLPPIIDLSFGVDYFYTPKFVIFAAFDNVFMQPNMRFENGKNKSWIYLMAGITYSFL